MAHVCCQRSFITSSPLAEQVTKIWHQKGNTYVLPRHNSNFVSSLQEKPLRQGLKPLQVRRSPFLFLCRGEYQGMLCSCAVGTAGDVDSAPHMPER